MLKLFSNKKAAKKFFFLWNSSKDKWNKGMLMAKPWITYPGLGSSAGKAGHAKQNDF